MKKLSQQEIENELIALTTKLLSESGEPYKREIKMNVSLQRHLGIDSLSRSELFRRIEKTFDVTIPDKLLAEAENLNDVLAYLQTTDADIKQPISAKKIITHHERANVDPSQAHTLIETLLLYVEKAPDKPHIYFQHEDGSEEVITYNQLLQSALRVAQGFRDRDLREGETVAIMLPTHPSFLYTFFGVLLAGGIPVPIYPPFRMHMLEAYAKTEAKILRNAEVRLLVTFPEASALSKLLQAFVPSLKEVTSVDALMQQKPLEKFFNAKAQSSAFIQYTSGSTNDPKGVLLSHGNTLANLAAYGKAIQITPSDVAVSWLPLYHDFGLIGAWLGSLYHGMPLVLLTPFSFLNHPEKWLWAVHYHRGTLSGGPNFGYELCIQKIDHVQLEGLDLSSWRVCANGAEKVYPRTLEQFTKKFEPYGFKRHVLMPVYGLAESTVGLTIPPLGRDFRIDHVDRKQFEEHRLAVVTEDKNSLEFVGCGMPIPDHEVRIVDNENNVLPERHVGNLQFRGPSSMQGYYNNPEATQAIYHDGWFESGDLAYISDGEIFITGRQKDLIIKAGRNLYPVEIEELVGSVPGIRRGCVAAFGVTDGERGTEQLVIVAETREKNKLKREQIKNAVTEIISTTLDIVPDHIVLAAPRIVPKTSSGKLQRSACKKMYQEGKLGRFVLPPWVQVTKLGLKWAIQKLIAVSFLAAKFIYTLYVALIFIATLLPVYFIVRLGSSSLAAKTCRLWTRFLIRAAFCPLTIKGKEYFEKTSPMIFAANHTSYADAIIALAILPLNVCMIGKKELFMAPVIGTFMRKLNYLQVDRMDLSKGLEDTKRFVDKLTSGHSIFIFPEGTFGYAAGLRPFRLGAFKVAAEANVPVCPIALKGTRKILRDTSKLLRPARIDVTICEPVQPVGVEWEDVTQLRTTVRAKIAEYCGEPTLDLIAAQTVASKMPR
ncbi:MAG: hypothetical protein ACD_46C00200G0003 [uncultured bacterium]|nr:MAG: hypothetical protein ACD_46C00200G0003 [uncultured bacterium]